MTARWADKASGAGPREASVYVEWKSWFVTRVGQTKHRAQGLAMQVTAPFSRIGHDSELGRQSLGRKAS